jgi:hypothetical protein
MLALDASPQLASAVCGGSEAKALTEGGIGAVRIGATVEDVKRACTVVSDRVEEGDEAIPVRILRIRIRGALIAAEIEAGRVWRLTVDDQGLRTADGLAVGIPLTKLLSLPMLSAEEGEGALYATSPQHCGLSFRLSYHPADDEHRVEWTTAQLSALPRSTKVTQVLIFGCAGAGREPTQSQKNP